MTAPSTIRVGIRYPVDVHADAKAEAKHNDWSLNTYTIRAVESYTRRIRNKRASENT